MHLLVGDFVVEVHVMCQYKDLSNIVSRNFGIEIFGIVPADVYHLSDNGTYDEQSVAIHRRYGVVNGNNFVLDVVAVQTATDTVVEVEKGDKIPFPFA